jgi:ABC-2 type transport system permease protein
VISATVSALINLGINLVVVSLLAIVNGVDFHWYAFLFPLVLIQLYILSLGLAFLLGSLYVKWRDIGHIWDVVLQTLFYATPIIYPLSLVATSSELAAKILLLNPMAQIIQDARYLLIYEGTDTIWTYIANPFIHFIPIILTILIAVSASFLFKKKSREFAEEA